MERRSRNTIVVDVIVVVAVVIVVIIIIINFIMMLKSSCYYYYHHHHDHHHDHCYDGVFDHRMEWQQGAVRQVQPMDPDPGKDHGHWRKCEKNQATGHLLEMLGSVLCQGSLVY